MSIDVPVRTTQIEKSGAEKEVSIPWTAVSLETDIDVKEGQKVVVGKANLGNAGGSLILVVTAKVMD